MNLALFDFDGTISNKDSFLLFVQYAKGIPRYWGGCLYLSPQIVRFLLGSYPNYKLKVDFIRHFFLNEKIVRIEAKASSFCQDIVPTILRPKALDRLNWHKQNGDHIVIVSASLEVILSPWCHRNNYQLVATKLEEKEGRVTGALKGKNCRGKEKVRRIKELYDLDKYDTIYAYGDSGGDTAMLNMATDPSFKPFR